MSYVLNSTTIRRPSTFAETNSTQVAQNRTLGGSVTRDYFGSNKRVWILEYSNTNPSDYTTIRSIYNTYLSTGTAVAWEVTETNYTVSSTTVHVDLLERGFKVKGDSYISDFTLTLVEN